MTESRIHPIPLEERVDPSSFSGDRLIEAFELQRQLQERSYGKDPSQITDPQERVQFIKDMNLALQDELHEMLAEVGWKPWATSRHVNEDAAKGELVDAFHFFMNLCMAVKMDADELFERYKSKRLKNAKRQADGYDGIEGKCPGCKRALDDDAVQCQRDSDGLYHCAEQQQYFTERGERL